MNTSKIIKAYIGAGTYSTTEPITQGDYGYILQIEGVELPATYRVDFSNNRHKGEALSVYGNENGAEVPEELIATGKDIFAFYYYVGENFGKTAYTWKIPNDTRAQNGDRTPTPTQQDSIDQLIVRSNEAVTSAEQSASAAGQSAQSAVNSAIEANRAELSAKSHALNAEQSSINADLSANDASSSAEASAQSANQAAQIKADVESLTEDARAAANSSEISARASGESALSASNSALSSGEYASNALGYAESASESAQAASTKASEASQSATMASDKATESAQSTSQALTYKTDAESAKTASQTAQGLAESARDSAQGYAEDAQGYAEDAQASAESISASASQIAQNTADILKAFPTDSASGSIASFSDGADNLPLKSLIVDINPVQDLSHGDPSPENLCPISGWTSVDVEQRGVNVWDEEYQLGFYNANGVFLTKTTGYFSSKNKIPVKPSTDYAFCIVGKANQTFYVCFYGKDGAFLRRSTYSMTDGFRSLSIPSDTYYINFSTEAFYGTTYNHDISINYPSTDHDYHPYTGRSITINLGQTVYGGKLDVLSGELMVDRAMVDLGTLTYAVNNHATLGQYFYAEITALRVKHKGAFGSILYNALCSAYKVVPRSPTYLVNGTFCFDGTQISKQVTQIQIKNTAYTDAATFKIAMSGVQLVYELAEPIEIQLSPNQINSLYGQNNIWADSGDTEVEYRADTKLYISKKIAEAISALS